MRTFTLSQSVHDQWCIELTDATKMEHAYLRSQVCNSFSQSPAYKAKQKVHPFIQGGHDLEEGWILIEFWVDPGEAGRIICQEFLDFLNDEKNQKDFIYYFQGEQNLHEQELAEQAESEPPETVVEVTGQAEPVLTKAEMDAEDDFYYPPETVVRNLEGKVIHVTPPGPEPL